MHGRVLAIDFGTKRLGIAISDALGLTAQALPFVSNDSQVMAALRALIDAYQVSSVVVGLPKLMSGDEGEMARQARAFGERISETFELPVEYWDERLSSRAAETHLIAQNVSRRKRKQKIDSQAAAFFLQGYLDQRRLSPS